MKYFTLSICLCFSYSDAISPAGCSWLNSLEVLLSWLINILSSELIPFYLLYTSLPHPWSTVPVFSFPPPHSHMFFHSVSQLSCAPCGWSISCITLLATFSTHSLQHHTAHELVHVSPVNHSYIFQITYLHSAYYKLCAVHVHLGTIITCQALLANVIMWRRRRHTHLWTHTAATGPIVWALVGGCSLSKTYRLYRCYRVNRKYLQYYPDGKINTEPWRQVWNVNKDVIHHNSREPTRQSITKTDTGETLHTKNLNSIHQIRHGVINLNAIY